MNNIELFKLPFTLFLIAMVSILLGCTTAPEKTALEQNFGTSVRTMIEMQSAKPDDKASGLNGQKGEAVLGIYEKDVAKPKKVEQDIIRIDLGK